MSIRLGALPPPDCGDVEDCGKFGVWWFGYIPRRGPDRGKRLIKWVYAWRSTSGTYWTTSAPVESYFDTREDAVKAAQRALAEEQGQL